MANPHNCRVGRRYVKCDLCGAPSLLYRYIWSRGGYTAMGPCVICLGSEGAARFEQARQALMPVLRQYKNNRA